jgi:dipeptidyl aminopeptidase/acylaminoacyl peptidase
MQAALLLVAGCAAAWAADEPAPPPPQQGAFTLEQIMSYSFPTELTAAPRGNRIAWVFNSQGRRNIWVASCTEPCSDSSRFVARQLTRYSEDDGQEIGDVTFSADGNSIVYVRGGPKNQAGETPNPLSDVNGVEQAVWVIAWAGGPPRKIDAGSNPAVSSGAPAQVAYTKDGKLWVAALSGLSKPRQIIARGQNGGYSWSPDGRRLVFASGRGTHAFIAIYETGKASLQYVAPSVDRDSNPRWSPDGKSIAFVRQPARRTDEGGGGMLTAADRPNPWAIWTADAGTGQAREIWRSTTDADGSLPRMAGDALLTWAANDRIVYASEQDGWLRLYSISTSGGVSIALTPGNCEFEHVSWAADRASFVFSSNCGDLDRRHLWRVALSDGVARPLTPGEGLEWSPAISGDGKWLAHLGSDARKPAMPYVRAIGGGTSQMLAVGVLPADFPSTKMVVPLPVATVAADGMLIHNQLFLPRHCGGGNKCPALIYTHGGPIRQMLLGWHYMGYYHGDYAMNQYLASRGYIVLSVNYRSGIGYGRAFREAPQRGARGASEYQDVVAGGKYLQARADVDAARIGLWGGSYGGYLTAMGLARNSDIFAAGVDLHGVHDWSSGRFVQSGGLDAERRRVAREASPVASVSTWRSPVLLIHGDDDRNVNFAESVDLAARLREQKVEFEQLVFPDDVHDFLLHKHWSAIFAAATDFFDRRLKNKN